MSELIVLVPDVHHHHHDQRAVDALWSMIERERPAEVCILGDYIDLKAPARWSKGTIDEFAADILEECEAGRKNLASLRACVPASRLTFLQGNHEARLQSYVRRYGPALEGIVPHFSELLGFQENGVELKPQPYAIASGVRAIHGMKLTSSQNAAGQSAYKERMRFGHSIVQGHTHRLGLGFDYQDKSRFWLEAGHLLDIKQATYLDFREQANWQQGFGYLVKDGNRITPGIVQIHSRGRFYFNGSTYGG